MVRYVDRIEKITSIFSRGAANDFQKECDSMYAKRCEIINHDRLWNLRFLWFQALYNIDFIRQHDIIGDTHINLGGVARPE